MTTPPRVPLSLTDPFVIRMDTQYVLILEKLQGLDILTYFQLRHEYNENMVATVVTQVRLVNPETVKLCLCGTAWLAYYLTAREALRLPSTG